MPAVEHMKVAVLDTHAWIWLSAGDARAAGLRDFRGRVVISAISVWEVAMLESKGRLELEPSVEEWVESNLRSPVELEPIHPLISIRSCQLENFHGDPADRLIVATAMVLGVPLITADSAIIEWSHHNPAPKVVEM